MLLPRLVERGKVYAHALEGYWRDLGEPHRYLAAHLELVRREADLFRASWPVRTQQPQREAAYVDEGGVVADSLLSPGSRVAGTVTRSVLGPGVVVEAGASVVGERGLRATPWSGRVPRSPARSWTRSASCWTARSSVATEVDLEDADPIPVVGSESRVSAPGARRVAARARHQHLTPRRGVRPAPSPTINSIKSLYLHR